MRLRKLLILDKKSTQLQYSREYYVSEALCSGNPDYSVLPAKNETFISAFLEKFKVDSDNEIHFKPVRDSCDRPDWYPVMTLEIEAHPVWPVTYITTPKHIIIGVPVVRLECRTVGYTECFEIPASVALLETISKFLVQLQDEMSGENCPFEIEDMINFIAPYGYLTNSSVSNFRTALSGTINLSLSTRDFLQSGAKQSPVLKVKIKETARGIIYNRKRHEDKFDYTGSVSLVSTLPVCTDLSISLLTTLNLTHVAPGPSIDKFHDTTSDNALHLFVTPGNDICELFTYTFDQVNPPIRGTYKVKKSGADYDFEVILEFYPEQKVTFDYVEVTMPFPNRGPITSLKQDSSTDKGQVVMNKKNNRITWKRPRPPATDCLQLKGTLTFNPRLATLDGHPHQTGLNCYMEIAFVSSSSTLSKMRLDKEALSVFPRNKFKLIYEVKSTGSPIRVWNSFGEILD